MVPLGCGALRTLLPGLASCLSSQGCTLSAVKRTNLCTCDILSLCPQSVKWKTKQNKNAPAFLAHGNLIFIISVILRYKWGIKASKTPKKHSGYFHLVSYIWHKGPRTKEIQCGGGSEKGSRSLSPNASAQPHGPSGHPQHWPYSHPSHSAVPMR